MSVPPPRVLVPAAEPTGRRIAPLLRSAGLTPVLAPLIASRATLDDGALAAALDRAVWGGAVGGAQGGGAGGSDWVVITSAVAARLLGGRLLAGCLAAAGQRIAAVGQHTAEVLAAAGVSCALVGADGGALQLADALIEAEPEVQAARVLLLGSAQSHTEIDERLRGAGAQVRRLAIYETVPVAAPPAVLAAVRAGEIAAVLITSGTVAAQVARQLGGDCARLPTVSLGSQTTADARALGLRIDAQASTATLAALLAATVKLLDSRQNPVGKDDA